MILTGRDVTDNIDIDNLTFTTPSDEALKTEQSLEISAFGTTTVSNSYTALALRVQQLFLLEPGTNPAAITMGIGIRNYLMELADKQTLDEIYNNAKSQLDKFLPSDEIRDISVEAQLDASNIRTLIIKVFLHKTNDEFKSGIFAVTFSSNNTNSKVYSQIYI